MRSAATGSEVVAVEPVTPALMTSGNVAHAEATTFFKGRLCNHVIGEHCRLAPP
jgi:hypothetical protein